MQVNTVDTVVDIGEEYINQIYISNTSRHGIGSFSYSQVIPSWFGISYMKEECL